MHFLILTTYLFVWVFLFFLWVILFWKGVPRYLLMIADGSTMYFEKVEGPIERKDSGLEDLGGWWTTKSLPTKSLSFPKTKRSLATIYIKLEFMNSINWKLLALCTRTIYNASFIKLSYNFMEIVGNFVKEFIGHLLM